MQRKTLGKRNIEKDAKMLRALLGQASSPGGGAPTSAQYLTLAINTTLTQERVLTPGDGIDGVDAGAGLAYTISADFTADVPSTIDAGDAGLAGSATYPPRRDHQHAVASSSNPGAAASLLQSDSSGYLQLIAVGIGTTPTSAIPLLVRHSSTPLKLEYDGSNYTSFLVNSGGNLIIAPTGDLSFNPTGNDVIPGTTYDINLGTNINKWLTIHAAELWVETLVAQDTIATIGGRILVGPTTMFTSALSSSIQNGADLISNGGFETAGGGGSDVFLWWSESASDGNIIQSATKHSGTYSCQLAAGASVDTHLYQNIPVTALDYMSLSFWTRSGDLADVNKLRYRIYDLTNTTDIISIISVEGTAGDTTWVMNRKGFQVPSGCTNVLVYFYCPATDTDSGFVDDVVLKEGVQISVEHDEMAEGDIVYSESGGSVEFFAVLDAGTGVDPTVYHVERNLDGSGYNTWFAGTALFNTGTVDEGFIDLYSIHGVKAGTEYGPSIVGNVRNSDYYNDWTPHWAIGNLNGIYGEGVTTYGVGLGDYAGNNYLKYTSDDGILQMSTAGGFVTLGDDGLTIFIADQWQTQSGVTFVLGSTEFAALEVRNPIGINDVRLEAKAITGANTYAGISSFAPASKFAISFLTATYTAGPAVSLQLFADSTSSYATFDMGSAGSLAIYGGLYVGTTGGNDIPAGQIHSTEQIRIGGGLVVGSIGVGAIDGYAIVANGLRVGDLTNPTNDDIRAIADIVAGGGLYSGLVTGEPATGVVHYTANLISRQSSVDYNVYGLKELTVPLTSVSWDGDSFSDVSTSTQLDLSSVFGAPAGISAVLLQVINRDSATWGTDDLFFQCGPSSTYYYAAQARTFGGNVWASGTYLVPCDSNGDVWYRINASDTSTMDIYLRIWGYCI